MDVSFIHAGPFGTLKGLVRKVVDKLDRISRSILDFANMMELFQKYNVEFVSSTEKFYPDGPGNAQHLYHSQDNGKQV